MKFTCKKRQPETYLKQTNINFWFTELVLYYQWQKNLQIPKQNLQKMLHGFPGLASRRLLLRSVYYTLGYLQLALCMVFIGLCLFVVILLSFMNMIILYNLFYYHVIIRINIKMCDSLGLCYWKCLL